MSVIQPAEKQELAKLKAALSDRLTPTRDGNGFRKLLVVTSQAGEACFQNPSPAAWLLDFVLPITMSIASI